MRLRRAARLGGRSKEPLRERRDGTQPNQVETGTALPWGAKVGTWGKCYSQNMGENSRGWGNTGRLRQEDPNTT